MNKREIQIFEKHIKAIIPTSGEIPSLNGYDFYGESFQLNEFLGGDHIIYIDFKKRYDIDSLIKSASESNKSEIETKEVIRKLEKLKSKSGILIADVSGHDKTDVILTNGFHQAFLTAVTYELKHNGDVTLDLFEILNTRFGNSSNKCKFFTLIYGEFYENGEFRFISAGHPLPLIYSYEQEAVCNLHKSTYASSLPMSVFPSEKQGIEFSQKKTNIFNNFQTNTSRIPKSGDLVILYTDGLSEHVNSKSELYFNPSFDANGGRIQEVINANKDNDAKEMFFSIKEDLLKFGKQKDDISFVIIKKK